jgi:hypothetical protein
MMPARSSTSLGQGVGLISWVVNSPREQVRIGDALQTRVELPECGPAVWCFGLGHAAERADRIEHARA